MLTPLIFLIRQTGPVFIEDKKGPGCMFLTPLISCSLYHRDVRSSLVIFHYIKSILFQLLTSPPFDLKRIELLET